MLDVEIVLVTVALVITPIALISLIVFILEALEILNSITMSFVVDNIGLLLVLHLENAQSIKIENPSHFDVQLLFNFYLFSLGEDSGILIVNHCECGPILKTKINERFPVSTIVVRLKQAKRIVFIYTGGYTVFTSELNYLIMLVVILVDQE